MGQISVNYVSAQEISLIAIVYSLTFSVNILPFSLALSCLNNELTYCVMHRIFNTNL